MEIASLCPAWREENQGLLPSGWSGAGPGGARRWAADHLRQAAGCPP